MNTITCTPITWDLIYHLSLFYAIVLASETLQSHSVPRHHCYLPAGCRKKQQVAAVQQLCAYCALEVCWEVSSYRKFWGTAGEWLPALFDEEQLESGCHFLMALVV